MSTASALDRMLDPVTACFTPQAAQKIVNLKLDSELVSRIETLAAKANEGTITSEEDAEYKDYIESGDMVALLQAKARQFLNRNGG